LSILDFFFWFCNYLIRLIWFLKIINLILHFKLRILIILWNLIILLNLFIFKDLLIFIYHFLFIQKWRTLKSIFLERYLFIIYFFFMFLLLIIHFKLRRAIAILYSRLLAFIFLFCQRFHKFFFWYFFSLKHRVFLIIFLKWLIFILSVNLNYSIFYLWRFIFVILYFAFFFNVDLFHMRKFKIKLSSVIKTIILLRFFY